MHWKRLLHHLLTSHHPNLLSSRTELEGWCISSEAYSDQDTTQIVTYCQIACSRYATLLLSLHGLFSPPYLVQWDSHLSATLSTEA